MTTAIFSLWVNSTGSLVPALERIGSAMQHGAVTGLRPLLKEVVGKGVQSQRVDISGWVKSVRIQKKMGFALVNDGSTQHGLQILGPPDLLRGCCHLTSASLTVFAD